MEGGVTVVSNEGTRSEKRSVPGDPEINLPSSCDSRVIHRLHEVGLDTKRAIPLANKGPREKGDWNPRSPDEIDGNYGIVGGDGLTLLDIDAPERLPERIEALPDTFTVGSPHGGTHRYYTVEGDVGNSKHDWGSIRVENQYVVGPGSELNSCDKPDHDCSEEGEGRYTIRADRPIARIDADELPSRSATSKATEPDEEPVPELSTDFTEIEAEFDVETRLVKAMDCAYGEKFTALWEGRHDDAGYGDRSSAETALASYLAWWMDNDCRIVAALMDRANTRKWAERREVYRESVLDTACDHTRTYDPGHGLPEPSLRGDRPPASYVTIQRVHEALLYDLGAASTDEILEHERVDRGKRAVQYALDLLSEDGHVAYTKRGRRGYWYSTLFEDELDTILEGKR